MKKVLCWLVAAAFVTAAAFAPVSAADKKDEKKKPDKAALFKMLDKDADGKLTEAEFVGKREGEKADKAKTEFKALDKNSDGTLSLEEFTAPPKKKK